MKRLSLMLCLILVISVLVVPVASTTHGEAYDELSSDAFREAYRLLEEGIAGMAPTITFPKELGIRYLDLRDIARAVCLDHPEYFWFLESWFYEYSTDGHYLVDTITPTYYLDHQQVSAGSQALADAMISFHSKVNEIISGIPVNCTSDYDIALYLHDYLADHVTYTMEGDHDSAYAALIHGKAACYGYSKAYHYLLSQAGVRSRIIVGDSLDPDGVKYGHAWNQVWIDGACYYTDVTWDDLEGATIHQYFLVSLEEISSDHIAEEMFPLPQCGHNLDFYQLSQGKGVARITDQTTAKEAAENFKLISFENGQAVFACEMQYDGSMDAWLQKNDLNLLNALGLSYKTEMSYYIFDDVYYLILIDAAYKPSRRAATSISMNITEATLKGAGAQAQLEAQVAPSAAGLMMPVFTSDNEAVAVVSSNGMVTAVGSGTATITATSYDGKVSAQCFITVEEGSAHTHVLRYIGASDPTCTLDGNEPYYICTGCFHRFADDAAELELPDVSAYARSATGHINLYWQPKQNSHYQVCECGTFIPQTTGNHVDQNEDEYCDLCDAQMNKPTEPSTEDEKDDHNMPKSIIWVLAIPCLLLVVGVIIFLRRRFFW